MAQLIDLLAPATTALRVGILIYQAQTSVQASHTSKYRVTFDKYLMLPLPIDPGDFSLL